jgi:hypothetical protein
MPPKLRQSEGTSRVRAVTTRAPSALEDFSRQPPRPAVQGWTSNAEGSSEQSGAASDAAPTIPPKLRQAEGTARARATTARATTSRPTKQEHPAASTAEQPGAAPKVRTRAKSARPEFPAPIRVVPPVSYAVGSDTHHLVDHTERNTDGSWADRDMVASLRLKRYKTMKEELREGKNVESRSTGNSMASIGVYSDDICRYAPINLTHKDPNGLHLHVGDIVLCEVQPMHMVYWNQVRSTRYTMREERFFVHMVKRIGFSKVDKKSYYVISGAKGKPENGWCYIEHVHGKLTHSGPSGDAMKEYKFPGLPSDHIAEAWHPESWSSCEQWDFCCVVAR